MAMKDKWLDEIKDKVSGFEMEAPDGLWDSICQNMEPSPAPSSKRAAGFKTRRFVYAAASIVLVLGFSGLLAFWLADDDKSYQLPEIKQPSSIVGDNNMDSQETRQEAHGAFAEAVIPAPVRAQAMIDKTYSTSEDNEGQGSDECRQPYADDNDNIEGSSLQENNLPADRQPTAESESLLSQPYDEREDREEREKIDRREESIVMPIHRKASAHKRFSIGASTSASGAAAAINVSKEGGGMFGGSADFNHSSSDDNKTRMGGLILDGFELPTTPGQSVFEHKLPIRVSADISWRLSRYFAVETGVSYTLLNSDISYGGGWKYERGKQSLHYVGLPVSFRYIPFEWKRLEFYIGAGALFEKCVAGVISSGSSSQSQFSYTGSDDRPFQFSLNASAGVQYNITDGCGIFAQPGVSWYADDGSRLRTIYKEKPWNFNLNIGIRFNLKK